MTLPTQTLLASHIATAAHLGQVDKGDQPYISHPMRVAFMVPDEYKAVALLHDVLEDTEVGVQELIEFYVDPNVILDVITLSRDPDETKAEYRHRILEANHRVRTVKLADVTDNLDGRRPYQMPYRMAASYDNFRDQLLETLR